jgi:hypothetical protein
MAQPWNTEKIEGKLQIFRAAVSSCPDGSDLLQILGMYYLDLRDALTTAENLEARIHQIHEDFEVDIVADEDKTSWTAFWRVAKDVVGAYMGTTIPEQRDGPRRSTFERVIYELFPADDPRRDELCSTFERKKGLWSLRQHTAPVSTMVAPQSDSSGVEDGGYTGNSRNTIFNSHL